jgi:preprotein translocase subunit SecF
MQIISKRKYFYVLSGILITASILAISVWGLNFGIDFTGGTQMDIKFENQAPQKNQIEEKLTDLGLESLSIQSSENNETIIKYKNSDEKINTAVFEKIKELDENAQQLSVDFIGASVSDQLKKSAVKAILLAIFGIAIYIAWAFRHISRPVKSWKYGVGAVLALAHDVIITIGAFAFFGEYFNIEVGVPFVAALLTILGYSVNDTIVVFDRTRENLLKSGNKDDFEEIVNRSLNETLARSINTSLTVILVLVAIIFFGGETIKLFSLALLIGVTFGTYSSIYVATALLVSIYKYQIKSRNA